MIRICSKSSSYCGIEHSIVANSKAVVVAEVEVAVEALGNADSSPGHLWWRGKYYRVKFLNFYFLGHMQKFELGNIEFMRMKFN